MFAIILLVLSIGAIVGVLLLFYNPLQHANSSYYSSLSSSPQTTTSTTSSLPVLRVGTSPDFPPFEYIDDKGNIVGFDIDLINILANMTGYKVQIVPMSFDSLILALQNKQIDVIASAILIKPEREKVVSFTIPYWNATMAIMVKNGSSFMPKSLDDLVGKTVGVQTGTTGQSIIEEYNNQSDRKIIVKAYENYILIVQDLVNGKIDATILDLTAAEAFAKNYPVTVAFTIDTGHKFGLAVNKDNTELLNQLNSALQNLMSSPQWDKIVSKWFG